MIHELLDHLGFAKPKFPGTITDQRLLAQIAYHEENRAQSAAKVAKPVETPVADSTGQFTRVVK